MEQADLAESDTFPEETGTYYPARIPVQSVSEEIQHDIQNPETSPFPVTGPIGGEPHIIARVTIDGSPSVTIASPDDFQGQRKTYEHGSIAELRVPDAIDKERLRRARVTEHILPPGKMS